jgi:hypothetical protein
MAYIETPLRKLAKHLDGEYEADAKVCREAAKELAAYRKALKSLTADVATCLKALDLEMHKREGADRGKRVAQISNALEMQNDKIRFFVLNEPH